VSKGLPTPRSDILAQPKRNKKANILLFLNVFISLQTPEIVSARVAFFNKLFFLIGA
jgi:hypothetical protein